MSDAGVSEMGLTPNEVGRFGFDRGGELEQWARSRAATRQIIKPKEDDDR